MDATLNFFKQNIRLIGVLLAVFVFGFNVTYFGLKTFTNTKGITIIPTPNPYSQASPAPLNNASKEDGVYNILLLGYGGAGHAGSNLTDSIIVIHIDVNTKKLTFISIPRDLWVTGSHKINTSGIAGFKNTGPVVQNVTGLPINYYIAVDFGGFSKIIDNLGGITVQVPATFDDPFYPITGEENNTCGKTEAEINALKAKYSDYSLETQFTCRYEHLHFGKGPATLDGATALKFVRSRHGDSDFGRSLRQFAVLTGISKKLISLQTMQKFDEIVATLMQIVKTDLNSGIVKTLIQVTGDPGGYKLSQIQLNTDNVLSSSTSRDGQYILIPKSGNFQFDGIKGYIKQNI